MQYCSNTYKMNAGEKITPFQKDCIMGILSLISKVMHFPNNHHKGYQ